MKRVRKERNRTASALFGAAAFQCLLGFVAWSMNGRSFGPLDWIAAFSGVFYIGLAFAAHWVRRPAALMGAGLYASYLAWQALHGLATLRSGLIFKIPVALLLLLAVMVARRSPGPSRSEKV